MSSDPVTVFATTVVLVKSVAPRQNIHLKEHLSIVNSMQAMVIGDQGAGKSLIMNGMKAVLNLVEKDMKKRQEDFHTPWVLSEPVPPYTLHLISSPFHPRLNTLYTADLSIKGIIKCMETAPTLLKSAAIVLLDELNVLTEVTEFGASQDSKCRSAAAVFRKIQDDQDRR